MFLLYNNIKSVNADLNQGEKMTLLKFIMICNAIVTICSLIAALTPTPKDDNFFKKVYSILDLFALNIGRAKEK